MIHCKGIKSYNDTEGCRTEGGSSNWVCLFVSGDLSDGLGRLSGVYPALKVLTVQAAACSED